MHKRYGPFLNYSAGHAKEILTNLEAYGFSVRDVCSVVRKFPATLGYAIVRTNDLFAALEKCGYAPSEVRTIIIKQPALLSRGSQRLYDVFEIFRAHDFSDPEIMDMIKSVPAILCYALKRTNANLVILKKARIDLTGYGCLIMLSTELLRGRIAVFHMMNIVPEAKQLNIGVDKWERCFGMTRQEVIAYGKITFTNPSDTKPASI